VLIKGRLIPWYKQVELRFRLDRLPFGRVEIVFEQPLVLFFPKSPAISMDNLFLKAFLLYEEANGYALPDVEDVLVLASVRASLFLQSIAVQVEQINVVKAGH